MRAERAYAEPDFETHQRGARSRDIHKPMERGAHVARLKRISAASEGATAHSVRVRVSHACL